MNFHIIINGNKVDTLKAGETTVLELESGEYELKIRGGLIVYSNKLSFNISKNETKEFTAEVFKNGFVRNYIKLRET